MVILLWCWVRYRESHQFDYDESLTQKKFFYVLVAVFVTLFVSSLLVSAYTYSSIWVPQPHMTLALGGLSLSAILNDLLYQLALVSNSEETMVLGLMQALRRKLATVRQIPLSMVPHISIILPRIGWGILHAYVSYVGELQLILVVSAIVSGCVISYVAYYRSLGVHSLLAAVLIHAFFNWAIVLARALGLL